MKKHLKLLKTMIEVKNKELEYHRLSYDTIGNTNLPTSRADIETNQKSSVRKTDQSERGAPDAEVRRNLGYRMNRDDTTDVTYILQTEDVRIEVTDTLSNNAKIDMEKEEARLLRVLRDKFKRRENERARREARVEHLKELIAKLSDDDDIPSEEDRQIEKEIDEAERLVNARNRLNTIFRVSKEVRNLEGDEVATFDATVILRINPMRIGTEKQAILAAFMMKDHEVVVETKLMGDIDMNLVQGVTVCPRG